MEVKKGENSQELEERFGQLNSVEMFISNLNCAYQFKVWGNARTSMFVLVKEDSEIVGNLNIGEVFSMKYFNSDPARGFRNLDTEIKYFNKIDFGKFKGHYLTGLSIV